MLSLNAMSSTRKDTLMLKVRLTEWEEGKQIIYYWSSSFDQGWVD